MTDNATSREQSAQSAKPSELARGLLSCKSLVAESITQADLSAEPPPHLDDLHWERAAVYGALSVLLRHPASCPALRDAGRLLQSRAARPSPARAVLMGIFASLVPSLSEDTQSLYDPSRLPEETIDQLHGYARMVADCARALKNGDFIKAAELWDRQVSLLTQNQQQLLDLSARLEVQPNSVMSRAGRALALQLNEEQGFIEGLNGSQATKA